MPRRTRTVSRRKLLRLFGAATALAAVGGCGGGATPTAVAGKAKTAGGEDDAHAAEAGRGAKGLRAGFGPTYVIRDRLVNLADAGGRRYLRFSVAIEFEEHHEAARADPTYEAAWSHPVDYTSEHPGHRRDARLVAYEPGRDGYQEVVAGKDPDKAFRDGLKKYVPAIEDVVVAILSSKTYADVGTSEGREPVKAEIQARLNGLLGSYELHVTNVYFTEFVVQ